MIIQETRSKYKLLKGSFEENFRVRIHRALSWFEKAETLSKDDLDLKYITLWISFNAALISKSIGPAIIAAGSIYDLYCNYKSEQEAENRARRKAQAVLDASNSTKMELRKLFSKQLDDLFTENIDPVIEKVKTQLQELRKNYQFNKEQEGLLNHVESILKI